jgi:superfamily II DNA/RNA helicase
MKFADLGLSDELLRAVTESGYDEPTPIQAGAIPSVLMMRDMIGIAQTGTGKTASFVLPMIDIADAALADPRTDAGAGCAGCGKL